MQGGHLVGMEPSQDRFLAAILKGDLAEALSVAQEARSRGLPFVYEELIARSLVEVGRLWQAGRISVADEHVATAIAQSVIASFYPTFPWAAAGPKGIVGCVEGERHELGARMAADLLVHDGWNVMYVGADVPLASLVELVVRTRPVFVGLSFAMAERLPHARDAIARLRREAPDARLLLGGRGVTVDPASAQALGAEVVARSAISAMEVIRAWKR
jgi:MerR family transcriptional regulator, light-induced transcriptional regulator